MNKTYDGNFWDKRYDQDEYVYGTQVNDFLREHSHILKHESHILCIAEGEGRNAVYLATQGHKVSAVDMSTVGRQKALKLAQEKNVELDYQIGNLQDYDLRENHWNAIISIFAHTPSELRSSLHARIIKALKPQGILLLEGYNLDQLSRDTGGPKNTDMLYSKDKMEKDFQELTIQHSQEIIRDIQEGDYHNGESSVYQLIARKN